MGNVRDHDVPRIRALLETRCHIRGVADRCVVHPKIAADASHNDQSRVDSLTHVKIDPSSALEIIPITFQHPADSQRCMDGPLRMVLMRNRRAEESHDTVPKKLGNGPLVPMDLA